MNHNFENLENFFLEFLNELNLTPATSTGIVLDTVGMILPEKESVRIDIDQLAKETGKAFNEVDTIFDSVYKKYKEVLYRRSGATCSYVSWRPKK